MLDAAGVGMALVGNPLVEQLRPPPVSAHFIGRPPAGPAPAARDASAAAIALSLVDSGIAAGVADDGARTAVERPYENEDVIGIDPIANIATNAMETTTVMVTCPPGGARLN